MAGDLCFAYKRFKSSAYKLNLSGILSRRTLDEGVDLVLVVFIDVLVENSSPKKTLI